MDFRQKFKKDVVIDMLCYRRRGHNEGDDPSMTQPAMYDVIDTKRGVRKTYTESLIGRGDISMKEAEDALRDYQGQLERVFNEVRELEKHEIEPSESVESDQMLPAGMNTAVDKSLLARIGDAHLAVPEGFTVHPRVKPVLEKRREMAYEGKVDWAFGELLALGTLIAEGKLIRLSGQDTRRGTFTQRHSVIIDRKTGAEFTPLQLLAANADGSRPAASSWSTTRRCPSTPRWASSTATRWATPTQWCCGRRSSATSSTARSRSSTSSSAPARPSGVSCPTSCCCCRTATRARVPTTRRAASSGSCSCAPRAR